MQHHPRAQGARSGILLVVGAALIFALSDAAAKFAVAGLDPVQVFWTRSLVVVLLTAPVVIALRGPSVLRSARPLLQLARGLLTFGASILFLNGLRQLPLADTTAINFVWPVLITVLAVPILGEKVGVRRMLATAAAFAGMLVIVRPGSASFQAAALFPLAGALFWATASVLTRLLARHDRPETTILWSAGATLLLASLVLPAVWRPPTAQDILLCCLIGLGSAVSHAMIVVAYGRAEASALAPYAFVQLVFAAACGYLFFSTLPDGWTVAGALIIVASGIYTFHRERIRRLERQPAG